METHSGKPQVAIIKGPTPRDCVNKGILELGGISKFVNEEDQVFIKFNLLLPNGFPTNTNFDVLGVVIQACKDAGAKKIYVGCFPFKGFSINTISNVLGVKSYIENLGAELAFLDNSNYYGTNKPKTEQLKAVKKATLSTIEINDKKYFVPRVILESDKFISINQVNVDPIFRCRLSLLNSYSIVPVYNQELDINSSGKENFLDNDKYKQDLASKIIDVFTIKKPNLVINDLFYILEGAGPYIYKDSILNKTGIIIVGTDALSVDTVTLKLLKLDELKIELYIIAGTRGLGKPELTEIDILGENINKIDIDIDLCVSRLEDINIKNITIKPGRYCSGCFESSYHLLNLMKTNMVKDLKYISKSIFLVGDNPPDPEGLENIIIFGDCAINSTKNSSYRNITVKTKKKDKVKLNKNVLELPGCPSDIMSCVGKLIKFYGKAEVPTLNLFYKTMLSYYLKKKQKRLNLWEGL